MKIFELNGLDVIYWFDVEQYHKEHADKKRVLVWHGDSIAEFVFNAIEEIPLFFCGFGLGQYKADGDFVFMTMTRFVILCSKIPTNGRFGRKWTII